MSEDVAIFKQVMCIAEDAKSVGLDISYDDWWIRLTKGLDIIHVCNSIDEIEAVLAGYELALKWGK